MKSSDAASLNKFGTLLLKYQSSIARIGRASDKNCKKSKIAAILQTNLPTYFIDRWNRKTYKISSKQQREPGIKDFVDLVSKELNSKPERRKFRVMPSLLISTSAPTIFHMI